MGIVQVRDVPDAAVQYDDEALTSAYIGVPPLTAIDTDSVLGEMNFGRRTCDAAAFVEVVFIELGMVIETDPDTDCDPLAPGEPVACGVADPFGAFALGDVPPPAQAVSGTSISKAAVSRMFIECSPRSNAAHSAS